VDIVSPLRPFDNPNEIKAFQIKSMYDTNSYLGI